MKKALSLVEVLVSVILITIVIGAMLQLNSQNAQTLSLLKKSSFETSYLSIAMLQAMHEKAEKKYYLSDLISFEEDHIDKKLKEIYFEINVEEYTSKKLDENIEYPILLKPMEINIHNNSQSKQLTLIELDLL